MLGDAPRHWLGKTLVRVCNCGSGRWRKFIGVGPSCEAKVVYTPAHIDIPVNGGPLLLDLNHDGIADFSFSNVSRSPGDGEILAFLMAGAKAERNAIRGRGTFFLGVGEGRLGPPKGTSYGVFADALRAGFTVGSDKLYFKKNSLGRWLMAWEGASYTGSNTYGQWNSTQRRYLGFSFVAGGQIHYGWARFSVALPKLSITATLTGYAYETIPNKPIITGKTTGPDVITLDPASLGHLAQGASGLPAWRKSGGNWKSVAH
jgi:hypothetical protein